MENMKFTQIFPSTLERNKENETKGVIIQAAVEEDSVTFRFVCGMKNVAELKADSRISRVLFEAILLPTSHQERPTTSSSAKSVDSSQELRALQPLSTHVTVKMRSPEGSESESTKTVGMSIGLDHEATLQGSSTREEKTHLKHSSISKACVDGRFVRINLEENPVSKRGVDSRVFVKTVYKTPGTGFFHIHYSLGIVKEGNGGWMKRLVTRKLLKAHLTIDTTFVNVGLKGQAVPPGLISFQSSSLDTGDSC